MLEIIYFELPTQFAFSPFHDVLGLNARFLKSWIAGPKYLISRSRNPPPFVKTLIVREAAVDATEMPFAKVRGLIASVREQFCDGYFPSVHALRTGIGYGWIPDWYRQRAGAHCVAAGHDCRTARRALGFHVEVGKPHALHGELVGPRRRSAAHDAAAIATQFTVAEIVEKNKDNVGLHRIPPELRQGPQRFKSSPT